MITVLRTEADHPYNQSDAEVLGNVSGGFSLSEDQCTCADCGTDLEHGDSVTAFCRVTCPSIYHRWDRRAYFCRECAPKDLSDERLDDYRRSSCEALVTGTLRDKGYYGKYADGDGGWEKRWTYQDNKWAEFAGTRIEDRRSNPSLSPNITEVGGRQFNYTPEKHGKTVPVPATVLQRLLETTTMGDTAETTFASAQENPVRWARALLAAHDAEVTPCADAE